MKLKEWKNQTDIGKDFGISSIAVGKILTTLNLKDEKGATQKAIDKGYAKSGLWNAEKTISLLSVYPSAEKRKEVRTTK